MIQEFQYIACKSIAPADLTAKFEERMSYSCEKLILFGLGT